MELCSGDEPATSCKLSIGCPALPRCLGALATEAYDSDWQDEAMRWVPE